MLAWREAVMGSGRGRLSAGLAVMEFVVGLQFLVVTAVMPRVVQEIKGIEFYGAVFAGYMLAGLVSIPRSGHEADERGPAGPFARMVAVFCIGTAACGLAPTMPLLALARLVQGYGGGAMYSLAYGVVAKSYPASSRARMVALLTTVWVVSGIVGPLYGVVVAQLFSWRYVFLSIVPLAAASALLVIPSLRREPGPSSELGQIPLRWPVQLAVGSGLVVAGFSAPSWPGAAALIVGTASVMPSLRHVLPAGTFRARPGLPAAVAAAMLLSLSFFTADSFVPLLLTGAKGRSIAEAGLAVTLVSISWSAGTVWQARAVERHSLAALVGGGALVMVIGTAGFTAALAGAPLWLAYSSWTVAGLGMGVAFPSVFLAAVGGAEVGEEASAVSARFVSGRLGIVIGTGLGGFSIALASQLHAPLATGLAGAFGLATVGSILCVLVSRTLRASA